MCVCVCMDKHYWKYSAHRERTFKTPLEEKVVRTNSVRHFVIDIVKESNLRDFLEITNFLENLEEY